MVYRLAARGGYNKSMDHAPVTPTVRAATRRPRRFQPQQADVHLLQVAYEVGILPTEGARWLLGHKDEFGVPQPAAASTTSERLKRLAAAELLVGADDPIRRPGGIRRFYAVTPAAYRYLRPVPASRRRAAVQLNEATLTADSLEHTLDVTALAVAVVAHSTAEETISWWGEAASRILLPGHRYLEPDGLVRYQIADEVLGEAWVEVDRATEGRKKWGQKLGLYAQALREGVGRRPLLITSPDATARDRLALLLAELLATPHAPDLPIWLAVHGEVADPPLVRAAVWQQVRAGASNLAQALYPERWWLLEVVVPDRRTPAEIAAQAAAQQAAAHQRAEQERREAAWRAQDAAAQARRDQEAAQARQAAAEQARAEAAARQRAAEQAAAEQHWREAEAAAARQRQAAEAAYRRTWRGRLETLLDVIDMVLTWVGQSVRSIPLLVWGGLLVLVIGAAVAWGLYELWQQYTADVTALDPYLGEELSAEPALIYRGFRLLRSPAVYHILGPPIVGLLLLSVGFRIAANIYERRQQGW
jgi:hypothetical protein